MPRVMADGRTGRAPRRRWLRRLLAAAAILVLVAVMLHQHVVLSSAPFTFAIDAVPARELIVVPGARIHADGRPYHLLEDRLAAAAALWRSGKADRILLSGRGGGGVAEDEVGAMRRWLVAASVPESALVEDPLGLRTLDTMYRAKDVFGAAGAIVVSNPFHVARAVFLGRRHGLDVVGVGAPHGHVYSAGTMWKNRGRETLARLLAVLDVWVLRTEATR
jgi:SanA protein